jgi:hypothetical protein
VIKELILKLKEVLANTPYKIKSTGDSIYTFYGEMVFEASISYSKSDRLLFVYFYCKPYLVDDVFWKITENERLSDVRRINGAFVVPMFCYENLKNLPLESSKMIAEKLIETIEYFAPTKADPKKFRDACYLKNSEYMKRNHVLDIMLLVMINDKKLLGERVMEFKNSGKNDKFAFVQPDGTSKDFIEYIVELL